MTQQSKLSTLLFELRRRRVFRVAAVYGGIAFVIVQIIDGTFELMGIPAWVGRLAFGAWDEQARAEGSLGQAADCAGREPGWERSGDGNGPIAAQGATESTYIISRTIGVSIPRFGVAGID